MSEREQSSQDIIVGGVFLVLLLALIAFASWNIARGTIASDCKLLGVTRINGAVYDCVPRAASR